MSIHFAERGPQPAATRPALARQAVVLAGGKGVRLRPYTTLIPKPIVPIGDAYSILEIVLRQLAEQGFERAVLAIGHFGQLIRAFVGDGSQWGIEVEYLQEDEPLGTMGPARMVLDDRPEHFLVMNGDVLTDLDYGALLEHHASTNAALTVSTYRRTHQVDFGVLDVHECDVIGFREKPSYDYSVSMGVYAVSKRALLRYPTGTRLGFDDLILDLLQAGERTMSYPFDGYWLDIGRPDDYDRANQEFESMLPLLLKNGLPCRDC